MLVLAGANGKGRRSTNDALWIPERPLGPLSVPPSRDAKESAGFKGAALGSFSACARCA